MQTYCVCMDLRVLAKPPQGRCKYGPVHMHKLWLDNMQIIKVEVKNKRAGMMKPTSVLYPSSSLFASMFLS